MGDNGRERISPGKRNLGFLYKMPLIALLQSRCLAEILIILDKRTIDLGLFHIKGKILRKQVFNAYNKNQKSNSKK